jgi:3-methyladenine DNA glycosylase AlkC
MVSSSKGWNKDLKVGRESTNGSVSFLSQIEKRNTSDTNSLKFTYKGKKSTLASMSQGEWSLMRNGKLGVASMVSARSKAQSPSERWA